VNDYIWLTDLHFNFIDNNEFIAFAERVRDARSSGVIITGDIATSNVLVYYISALEKIIEKPIYYVLGNHDFWGSSVEDVHKAMRELDGMSQYARYLPNTPYVQLSSTTSLVGHDGWYDVLNGNVNSDMTLNDWTSIGEYTVKRRGMFPDRSTIQEVSRTLAAQAAAHVVNGIKACARYSKEVIVATHVPPFPEAHVYNGSQGDAEAMPFFTSRTMGNVLLEASRTYPRIAFRVLCGHTHGAWSGNITKNLRVDVGGAEYGAPAFAGIVGVK
jgi:predicted MPP superfamily phosphohydrolase